ncbi:MAG: UDP-N-acetylmuramoylalanine--D-glutamate ligase [Bacteroidetes bacterium]|jgi:UDP-N-acetylmuramoylalanine--D-glutamate ligase|nr:UDP-N-acetylmuramoylalanine--D-glutamate ligase [Bacteroidota bacterium]
MTDNNKIKNDQATAKLSLLRQRVASSEDDHNMEFVDTINGVAYINDSRAIRITATRNSLEGIDTGIVLIIGGDDNTNDYSVLAEQVIKKVVSIIYLGNNSDLILKHFSSHSLFFAKAEDLKEAVNIADSYSRSGDVVLFSPACPNCSVYENYMTRGNAFKALIKELKNK